MSKKDLKAINKKARQMERQLKEKDVFGLSDDDIASGMPIGCNTIFDPGWETNPNPEIPVGNCLPSAKDFIGCSGPCWWPAQTPDGISGYPNYHSECAKIATDWRNLNFVIKR